MGIRRKGWLTARRLWCATAIGLLLASVPLIAIAVDDKPDGRSSRRDVFEAGRVWNVHITVPAAEYEAMQPRRGQTFLGMLGMGGRKKTDQPQREVHRNTFGMDLPWATASVTFDGETFQDVGIRYKGNGTIGDAARTIKKSFKIDLDHSGGTARFRGLKTINLHCGVADPSKCRESLGYGLYRAAGVPAPLTALAEVRLTVPGKYDRELLGLYTVVEQVDKPFLRDHFGADKGLLMKPEGLRDFEFKGDNWDRYQKQYLPKRDAEPEEIARIIAFARLVDKAGDDEFQKEIESYLDIDAYLRFLAATAFVSNSDSFFALGHNYYLYLHPTTGRFHFIPWDLDRAFSNLPVLGSNTQQMNLSFTHPYGGAHRLTDRLLAMPGMGERYQKLLAELAAGCFEKEKLLQQTNAAEAAVKDLLEQDARAAEARKDGVGGFGPAFGKPPAMQTFMEKRSASLSAQLAGTSQGHVPKPGMFRMGDMLAEPMLESLDTERDGTLSRDEWLAAVKKVFDACEKDEQQRVRQKGIADALNGMFPRPPEGQRDAGPPGFRPGNFMAGPIVRRADADRDGRVTFDEMKNAAEKLFDEFDKEMSGKLNETAFGELLDALFPFSNFGPPPGKPAEPKKDEP
jgi:hypothetical protein